MTILKLANAGESYTGHIKGCETAAGQFGPQIKFTFSNDDLLFLPEDSAARQLLRCGFDAGGQPPQADLAGVVGNTLTFSRTANTKTPSAKPYWNIAVAAAYEANAPAPSKRLVGPTQVPGDTPERYKGKPAPQSDPFDPGPPEPQDYPVRAVAGQPSGSTGRTREHIAAAYGWSLRTAYSTLYALDNEVTNIDMAVIQAGAATLMIQLERTGLLFQPVDKEAVKEALDLEEIFG